MFARPLEEMIENTRKANGMQAISQQARPNPQPFDIEGAVDGFFYACKDNADAWAKAGNGEHAQAAQGAVSQKLAEILQGLNGNGAEQAVLGLQDALQKFHGLMFNFVEAAKSGDGALIGPGNRALVDQAGNIANMLSGMNPQTWPEGTAQELIAFVEEMKAAVMETVGSQVATQEAPGMVETAPAPSPVLVNPAVIDMPLGAAETAWLQPSIRQIVILLRGKKIPVTPQNIRTWWALYCRTPAPNIDQIKAALGLTDGMDGVAAQGNGMFGQAPTAGLPGSPLGSPPSYTPSSSPPSYSPSSAPIGTPVRQAPYTDGVFGGGRSQLFLLNNEELKSFGYGGFGGNPPPQFWGGAASMIAPYQSSYPPQTGVWAPAPIVPQGNWGQLQSEPFTYVGPVVLQNRLRYYWQRHVFFTRQVLIAIDIMDSIQVQQAVSMVLANQLELGRMITQFYGSQAGNSIAFLLEQHIQLTIDYMYASMMDDAARQESTVKALFDNARLLSSELSKLNPSYWPETNLYDLLSGHLNHTKAYIDARVAGDSATDEKALAAAYVNARVIADALYAGIRRQYGLDAQNLTSPPPPAWSR